MGQTLLTVAAILVFSLFALNQHRAQAQAEHDAMGSEIEFAAAELARAELMEATALAFDEALIGSHLLLVDPNILTLPGAFGPGGDPSETASTLPDDVDDLNGVTETVTVRRDGQAGRTTPFTITRAVRYVLVYAPGMSAGGATRTLAKEVAVTVQEVTTAPTGRPPVRATLTQVVTPAWQVVQG